MSNPVTYMYKSYKIPCLFDIDHKTLAQLLNSYHIKKYCTWKGNLSLKGYKSSCDVHIVFISLHCYLCKQQLLCLKHCSYLISVVRKSHMCCYFLDWRHRSCFQQVYSPEEQPRLQKIPEYDTLHEPSLCPRLNGKTASSC